MAEKAGCKDCKKALDAVTKLNEEMKREFSRRPIAAVNTSNSHEIEVLKKEVSFLKTVRHANTTKLLLIANHFVFPLYSGKSKSSNRD